MCHKISLRLHARSSILNNNDADDNTVETKGTSEDFNDEHFHESSSLLRVNKGSSRSNDADGETTSEIGQTDNAASAEHGISFSLGIVEWSERRVFSLISCRQLIPAPVLWPVNHQDTNDYSINSDSLAEDNTEWKQNEELESVVCEVSIEF